MLRKKLTAKYFNQEILPSVALSSRGVILEYYSVNKKSRTIQEETHISEQFGCMQGKRIDESLLGGAGGLIMLGEGELDGTP